MTRSRLKPAIAVLVVIGMTVTAAVGGVVLARGSDSAKPTLSILDKPTGARDVLPGRSLATSAITRWVGAAPLSHLAAEAPGVQVFLAPGVPSALGAEQECVMVWPTNDPLVEAPALSCFDRDVLATTFPVTAQGFGTLTSSPTSLVVAGVAPDGFDTATLGAATTPITNNVFLFTNADLAGGTVTISGSSGKRSVEMLGMNR